MNDHTQRPLIVQSDLSVLLEVHHPLFEEARASLIQFADLVKSPDHIHTYKITAISLWNAASAGLTADDVIHYLQKYGKFAIPKRVRDEIVTIMGRCGLIRMELNDNKLMLTSDDNEALQKMMSLPSLQPYVVQAHSTKAVQIAPWCRGLLKQELVKLGYPVLDLAGYHQGETLPIRLRDKLEYGRPFQLRDYQASAVDAFYKEGNKYEGSGVLVLPCGAGKTVIGIAAMSRLSCATLILTTNVTSVKQWKREILDKTDVSEHMIGEYGGARKEVRPITIATYQILTYRKAKTDLFAHMHLFNERDWGLIIYDEVHLLPAPVFRVTADIQATRRLGLTATLVREDGREHDVFSLVGPKRFDTSWKNLEKSGWIAKVDCAEILVPLDPEMEQAYAQAESKNKFRIAGENPLKLEIVKKLLQKHKNEPTLIIGQYLDQLRQLSQMIGSELICGETPHDEREAIYERFRKGVISHLIVSKVANFAVDLPDARVAIQISGSFGSRQEEAQRLGRILRPKRNNEAYFYSIVSSNTKEHDFAINRQLFLVEQGYRYRMINAEQMNVSEVTAK